MNPKTDLKDYDDQILDVDELGGTDIKINPDFYIHSALLKMQQALASDNITDGHIKYITFLEHIETLCKSAKIVDEEYIIAVEKYKEEINYEEKAKQKETLGMKVKLANKKLELLMAQVFENKTIIEPLRDGVFKKKITNLDDVKEE